MFEYFTTFFQSSLLEVPIYFLLLRKKLTVREFLDWLILITCMNAVTHPLVFFVFMNLKVTFLAAVLLAEGFAIFSETGILKSVSAYSAWRVAFASLLANLISWQFGPILTYLQNR